MLTKTHSFIRKRSLFMANSTSSIVSPAAVRFVSSANSRGLTCLRQCGRSFMYKRNKSGPRSRMEPCGIPHVTRLSEVITSPSWHFCQPYFDYCSPLWDTCDKTLRNKLQILQNRAARVIMGTRYDDRIRSSDLLQSLEWDTLHVRWAKLKSVLLYKILNEN